MPKKTYDDSAYDEYLRHREPEVQPRNELFKRPRFAPRVKRVYDEYYPDPDCHDHNYTELSVVKTVTITVTASSELETKANLVGISSYIVPDGSKGCNKSLENIVSWDKKTNTICCTKLSIREIWCQKHNLDEWTKMTKNEDSTWTFSMKMSAAAIKELPRAERKIAVMAQYQDRFFIENHLLMLYTLKLIEANTTHISTSTAATLNGSATIHSHSSFLTNPPKTDSEKQTGSNPWTVAGTICGSIVAVAVIGFVLYKTCGARLQKPAKTVPM